MKMHKIHLTPEQILSGNMSDKSDSSLRAIQQTTEAVKNLEKTVKDKSIEADGFASIIKAVNRTSENIAILKEAVGHPEDIVRKLEEVKSAGLITNKLLKDISKKEMPVPKDFPDFPDFPTKIKVEIEGAELVTIKGGKGEKGDKGDKGDTIKGDKGEKGDAGAKGIKSEKGDRGERGITGKDGLPAIGADGQDGSPDTPEQIVEKLLSLKGKKKLSFKALKDVPNFTTGDTMNQVGYASGGANQIVYQGVGIRLSDYVQFLNFGAGLSASYSNGTILVVAQTSGSILTATGTIDDSNLAFTFVSQPSVIIVNGGTYQQTGGAITFTWTATTLTVTLSSACGTGGSIFGLI